MTQKRHLKITLIGAGSVSFGPATITDILLSEKLGTLDLEIALMDIDARALEVSLGFARRLAERLGSAAKISAGTDLDAALSGVDFVVTAIELERYHYWSMDFHIPRRYGFRQVYGENGGPGGMFHFLRNLPPLLNIARRMEALCPEAWLINYTNPEAKLVEAISKLTTIRAVGVCHGFEMGVDQIAKILDRPKHTLQIEGHGLNHFGFITKIADKQTGEDLYPEFKKREAECHWLAEWDELGLSRMMLRTYGLWPYPGTNHIGEYIAWSDAFLASSKIQFFFDPVREKPWETHVPPKFVYSFSSNPTGIGFHDKNAGREDDYEKRFALGDAQPVRSHEYGVPIIEAIVFDENALIPSLNMLNQGTMPGLMKGMCLEGPCLVDAKGVHPVRLTTELPAAVSAMINLQGAIHQLLIDAYQQKSRNLLLQALLLDPTISSYNNAVALIDEMFEREKALLPALEWKETLS